MADDAREREPAVLDESHVPRDVGLGPALAAVRADESLLEVEREGRDGGGRALRRNAHEHGPAAAAGQPAGQRDHVDVSGVVDHHICPVASHDPGDRLGWRGRPGVDRVRGPQGAGQVETVVEEVDRDDRVAARKSRPLDDVEADPARAKHHHRLPDRHLGIVGDDTEGRRDGAAKEGGRLHVEVGRHGGDAVF